MSDTYQPRHRKHVLTKTRPRLQPAPRHAADRIVERLGAEAPDIRALMRAHVDAVIEGRRLFGPQR